MNVTGIRSASEVLQTTAVSSTDSVSQVTQLDGPEPAGVSKMADLMKQLEELSQSDPEKFKEVMSSLAEQVQQQADAADEAGDGGAGFLGELAKKFQQAADTGDVSALKPPQPPQGGSPPPQRAKDAYGQSAPQPSLDLAQLIQSTLDQYSS
jgi:phage repressor protein C with HTH and peptisase S24 domain